MRHIGHHHLFLVLTVTLVAGCANQAPKGAQPTTSTVDAPAATSSAGATEPSTLVVTIVEAGPVGDGRCVQRSYRVAVEERLTGPPVDATWIHFERCDGADGPDFAALETERRYRVRVRRVPEGGFGPDALYIDAAEAMP